MPEEAHQVAWWPHYELLKEVNEKRGCQSPSLLREAEIVVRKCFTYGQGHKPGAHDRSRHEEHSSHVLRGESLVWDWVVGTEALD